MRPGATGLVVDEREDDAAAEAICRALDDPEAWQRMSTGARTEVERNRTYPAIADRFVEFLGDLRMGRA